MCRVVETVAGNGISGPGVAGSSQDNAQYSSATRASELQMAYARLVCVVCCLYVCMHLRVGCIYIMSVYVCVCVCVC
jgi:hypothetical protein